MSLLSRRLPPLATLVVFDAAFRHGSFSRAADEVALSQSSVSRQIRQLESNLGVSLFERRRHDVVPTAEAELLARTVRFALAELATTAERLRSVGLGGDTFTVYSDIALASVLVTPVLGEFQRRFPDLKLKVLSSYEPIEQVLEEFDLGFQSTRKAEDRFIVEAIADDLVFPVCSPGFACRLPFPVSAVEIASQPLLHLEVPGSDWPNWRRLLAHHRLKQPKPIEGLQFSSYQTCLEMAEGGHGIALGWGRSVKSRLDAGRLVRISCMALRETDSIFVFRPRRSSANPAADAFMEILKASIVPVEELLATPGQKFAGRSSKRTGN